MRSFFHGLSSWWFDTMVPTHTPLTTIDAREEMRKRRLFSIVLLISFVLLLLFISLGNFFGMHGIRKSIIILSCGTTLFALWCNRYGYLKYACLFFLLPLFLSIMTVLSGISIDVSILSLWPIFLILLIIAGYFLPTWITLMLASVEIVFMCWCVLSDVQGPIIAYISPSHNQFYFLTPICLIIAITALLSITYTVSTKKALIRIEQEVVREPDNLLLIDTHTDLETALAEAHAELEATRDKLEIAENTIHQKALTDPLTELPNRRAVMGQLEKEMERARRYDRALSLLFFDVDRLKLINDTYGSDVGDVVLRQTAERVISALRGGDTLGRFDGATFISLLPETDSTNAKIVAERIKSVIAAELMAMSEVPNGITITVSIGLATYPDDSSSEKELLSQADEALYIAKRLGRNQIRTAQEAQQISDNSELMARLQQEEQEEAGKQEEVTPERLKETHTLRVVYSLMTLLERRDENISMHSHAVSRLAAGIAEIMELDAKQVSRISMAALLHDIGKVTIPDVLLQKASTLSDDERVLVRAHAELGAQIMEVSPFLHDLVPAVRHHHEHWDGHGYPDELAGENIPLAARIIGVAEAYDSMRRGNPYQIRRSLEEAIFELQRCAGTQFDPTVVQALVTLLAKLHKHTKSLPLVG